MKDSMGSQYFDRSEFACKCGCGFDNINFALIEKLDSISRHFDKQVTITSGCRCDEHNRKIGGVPDSHHVQGTAADIVVKGVDPYEVAKYAMEMRFKLMGGVGIYDTFTHIDVRGTKAQWDGRT